MREIKFRAWIKSGFDDDVKPFMTYDIDRLHFNKGEEGIDAEDCEWDIDNFVLMQFTGLKDKNGKEIYEGDIIELVGIDISGSRTTEVVFHKGSFREKYMGYALDCYKQHEIKVIGNIYENPELLGGEKGGVRCV